MTLRRRDSVERTAELLRDSGQLIRAMRSDETFYANVNSGFANGDGSARRPWDKLNTAYEWLAQNVDQRGFTAKVLLANGIYESFQQNETIRATSGKIEFCGNSAFPTSVSIFGYSTVFVSSDSNSCINMFSSGFGESFVEVTNLTLLGGSPDYDIMSCGGNNHIKATQNIIFSGLKYGLASVDDGGNIEVAGTMRFNSADIAYFMYASNQAKGKIQGLSMESARSASLTQVGVYASNLSFVLALLGSSIQGPVSGQQYDVSGNSILNGFGLGFPGDVPGSTSTGGIVI